MKHAPACLLFVTALVSLGAASAADRDRDTPASRIAGELQTPAMRPLSATAKAMLGAWQLETRTVKQADGKVLSDTVLGERPLGRLYYDASGVVSLQMMRTGRKEAISVPAAAKDRANARVILGYDSYFGRFSVDEKAGTVTHHVEGSLFPEDLGKDFVRNITVEGDTLTLKFTSPDKVTRTLVFKRVR